MTSCGETCSCRRGKGTALWLIYLRLLTRFGFRSLQSCQKNTGHLANIPHPQGLPPTKDPRAAGWGKGAGQGCGPGWDNSPAGSTSRVTLCTVWGPEKPSTTQPYSPASSSCRATISTWSRPPPRSVRNMRLPAGAPRLTADVTKGWHPSGRTRHHTFRALTSWSR